MLALQSRKAERLAFAKFPTTKTSPFPLPTFPILPSSGDNYNNKLTARHRKWNNNGISVPLGMGIADGARKQRLDHLDPEKRRVSPRINILLSNGTHNDRINEAPGMQSLPSACGYVFQATHPFSIPSIGFNTPSSTHLCRSSSADSSVIFRRQEQPEMVRRARAFWVQTWASHSQRDHLKGEF